MGRPADSPGQRSGNGGSAFEPGGNPAVFPDHGSVPSGETSALPLLRHLHKTEIAMHRALQFLCGDGRPYHCTAGDSLMTVLPNGDLLPCRRMPVSVGNLKKKHLAELYYTSDFFRDLRDRRRISRGCENCFYQKLCRGGLKCLSYAVYGSPFRADPGCWRADPDA